MFTRFIPEVGDTIDVIDHSTGWYPIRGVVLETDIHPGLDGDYALIRLVDSPALPAPEIWVDLRLARKVTAEK